MFQVVSVPSVCVSDRADIAASSGTDLPCFAVTRYSRGEFFAVAFLDEFDERMNVADRSRWCGDRPPWFAPFLANERGHVALVVTFFNAWYQSPNLACRGQEIVGFAIQATKFLSGATREPKNQEDTRLLDWHCRPGKFTQRQTGLGPIGQAVSEREFQSVELLSNDHGVRAKSEGAKVPLPSAKNT